MLGLLFIQKHAIDCQFECVCIQGLSSGDELFGHGDLFFRKLFKDPSKPGVISRFSESSNSIHHSIIPSNGNTAKINVLTNSIIMESR